MGRFRLLALLTTLVCTIVLSGCGGGGDGDGGGDGKSAGAGRTTTADAADTPADADDAGGAEESSAGTVIPAAEPVSAFTRLIRDDPDAAADRLVAEGMGAFALETVCDLIASLRDHGRNDRAGDLLEEARLRGQAAPPRTRARIEALLASVIARSEQPVLDPLTALQAAVDVQVPLVESGDAPPEDLVDTYLELARLHAAANRTDDAQQAVRKAVAVAEPLARGDDAWLHITTVAAGNLMATRSHKRAREELDALVPKLVARFGPRAPITLEARKHRAAAMRWTGGKPRELRDTLGAIARDYERTFGPDHPATLEVWLDYCGPTTIVARHRNTSAEEKDALFNEVVDITRRLIASSEARDGPDHPRTGPMWSLLATAYTQMQERRQALTTWQRAYDVHRTTGSEARDVYIALLGVGRMKWLTGDPEGGLADLRATRDWLEANMEARNVGLRRETVRLIERIEAGHLVDIGMAGEQGRPPVPTIDPSLPSLDTYIVLDDALDGAGSLPDSLALNEQGRVVSGDGVIPAGNDVVRLHEPPGMRCVRLRTAPGSTIDLEKIAGRGALARAWSVALKDRSGTVHVPVGFVESRSDGQRVRLSPDEPLARLGAFPTDGSAVEIVFHVPVGTALFSFSVGPSVIGSCSVTVSAP